MPEPDVAELLMQSLAAIDLAVDHITIVLALLHDSPPVLLDVLARLDGDGLHLAVYEDLGVALVLTTA